jgi:hypothetical protein
MLIALLTLFAVGYPFIYKILYLCVSPYTHNMRPTILQSEPTIIPVSTHGKFINILGNRYGRMVVMGYVGKFSWFCKCDCGNMFTATSGHIRDGNTLSCGCLHKDMMKRNFTTHGESQTTPEYKAYCLAKSRCENSTDPAFAHYGGRGIKFCFTSYEDFLREVGRKPSKKHSLDRIDVNGNYEAGNIRWATWTEQARNRRNGRLLTIDGVTKCQAEWAIEFNTTDKLIDQRRRRGWCDCCAVMLHKNEVCLHK